MTELYLIECIFYNLTSGSTSWIENWGQNMQQLNMLKISKVLLLLPRTHEQTRNLKDLNGWLCWSEAADTCKNNTCKTN